MRPDGSQKLYPSTSCTPDFGLYYYGSRWYDPALGRFIQPDTIVPDPSNPQDLNRFSYVRNNPLRYTDPTGHRVCDDFDTVGGCYTAPGSPAGGTGGGTTYVRPRGGGSARTESSLGSQPNIYLPVPGGSEPNIYLPVSGGSELNIYVPIFGWNLPGGYTPVFGGPLIDIFVPIDPQDVWNVYTSKNDDPLSRLPIRRKNKDKTASIS